MNRTQVGLKALELYLVAASPMVAKLSLGLPEGRTADVVEQAELALRRVVRLLHEEHDVLAGEVKP